LIWQIHSDFPGQSNERIPLTLSVFTIFSYISPSGASPGPPVLIQFSSFSPDTSTTAHLICKVSVGFDQTFGKTIPHTLLYVFQYRKPVFVWVNEPELALLSHSPPDASLFVVPILPQGPEPVNTPSFLFVGTFGDGTLDITHLGMTRIFPFRPPVRQYD
jgi:hypothetical protein